MNTERSPRGVGVVLSRRRYQVANVAAGILLVAAGVALVRPRDYRCEARLEVAAVGDLDAGALEKRVRGVADDTLAQPTLEKLVTDTQLDASLTEVIETERVAARALLIEKVRARTELLTEPQPSGTWTVTIRHTAPEPETAFRVVSGLAAGFEDAAFRRPVEEAEAAERTARREAVAAEAEHTRLAAALEEFLHENAELLDDPEKRLADVRGQIQDVEQVEIAHGEAELARLDTMLAAEPPFIERREAVHDDALITRIEEELRECEARLTVLRVERGLTDEHPQVLAQLDIRRDLRAKLQTARDATTDRVSREPNEMHQSLRNAKVETEAAVARARRKLSVLRTNEQELVEHVRRAPEARLELEKLQRDADAARARHDERQARLAAAAEQLERVAGARQMRFATLAAAEEPETPTGPGALVTALAGLAGGVLVGAMVALVRDRLDRTVRGVDEAANVLGLPVLGAVHSIFTPGELAAERRATRHSLTVLGIVAGVAVLLVGWAALGSAGALQSMVRSVVE